MQERHMKQLDLIDRKILSILEGNGRETMVKIAERVGLSKTACIERIKRLEKNGVIKKYAAILEPALVDRGFVMFVHVSFADTSKNAFDRLTKAIAQIDEIEECHMVSGDYDLLLKIRQKDMNDFRRIITDKLSTIPGISRTNSYAVIEELKSGGPLMAAPAESE